jgi:cyanate lyase
MPQPTAPPPAVKHRKPPVPLADIIAYVNQGLTHQDIATLTGVSRSAITMRLLDSGYSRPRLNNFKTLRADLFAWKQSEIMDLLTVDCLKKAGARDLVLMAGILYDKERLERGQTTAIVATLHADLEALRNLQSSTIEINCSTISTKTKGADGIDITDIL